MISLAEIEIVIRLDYRALKNSQSDKFSNAYLYRGDSLSRRKRTTGRARLKEASAHLDSLDVGETRQMGSLA